jgi:hypothetical protein
VVSSWRHTGDPRRPRQYYPAGFTGNQQDDDGGHLTSRKSWELFSAGELFAGALLAMFASFGCYVMALVVSEIFTFRSRLEICPRGSFLDIEQRWVVPLSNKCLYPDGTSEQLVPRLVNPMLFLMLAIVLVFLWQGTRALFSEHSGAKAPKSPR